MRLRRTIFTGLITGLLFWVLALAPVWASQALTTQKTPEESGSVTVPDVRGKSQAEAASALAAAGLAVSQTRLDAGAVQPYVVTAQSPRAGSQVATGTQVDLTLGSAGNTTQQPAADSVTVPDVRGKSQAEAASALAAAGLAVSQTRLDAGAVQPYVVTAQSPRAGNQVATGTQVDLTLGSAGNTTQQPAADSVTVPDVRGKSQAEAASALAAAGLAVSQTRLDAGAVRPYVVTAQSPRAGNQVSTGTQVVLTLGSDGQPAEPASTLVTVPNLLLKTKEEINGLPNSVGAPDLVYQFVSQTVATADPDKANRVYAQNPQAGEQVPAGATVRLTLYAFAGVSEPSSSNKVTVPNIIGKKKKRAKKLLKQSGLVMVVLADLSGGATPKRILSQIPAAGTRVSGGSPVSVNLGP